MDDATEIGEEDIKEIENNIMKIKEFKEFFYKTTIKSYWT